MADDASPPEAGLDERALVERLLDVALYAPVGLVAVAHHELPAWVSAGRSRVEQRINLARFVGKLAVQQGQTELRKRVEARLAERSGAPAERPVSEVPPPVVAPDHAPPERPAPEPVADTASLPSILPGELAIADYDSLAAAQVVARLPGLGESELGLVEAYERAHRRRRTVLGRIAQLKDAG